MALLGKKVNAEETEEKESAGAMPRIGFGKKAKGEASAEQESAGAKSRIGLGKKAKDEGSGAKKPAASKPRISFRKKGPLKAVISVDPHTETIGFYVMGEDKTIQHNLANYKVRPYDQEFFDRFSRIVKMYREKFPQVDLRHVAVVLPDPLFLIDTVSVPTIQRRAMDYSVGLAIEHIYQNADDLNLMTHTVQQNKQNTTFGLVGMRRDVYELLLQACAQNGVGVDAVTFAANAMVNGAFAVNSKLRNGSFLMLDIKEDYARFAFVVRGCTMGYYDLPFGHGMLYKSRLAAEDMLFDHSAADLLVLNAKEKARAKQLTMGGGTDAEAGESGEKAESAETADNISEGGEMTLREENPVTVERTMDGKVRKTPRRLPKSMQRPTPQGREEYVYENFRIFQKWTLDLLAGNPEIVNLAKMETVYVNMPVEYNYLFDMLNAEQEENGVAFAPLLPESTEEKIATNLELYGGFYVHNYNQPNVF